MMEIYDSFQVTPGLAQAMLMIDSIRQNGPRAVAGQMAQLVRSAWGNVGTEHCPWQDFAELRPAISWLVDNKPALTHETMCRLHEIAKPNAKPHRYGWVEQIYYEIDSGRFLYACPPRKDVHRIMESTFALVERHPVPIGNALLHLNFTAAHPFEDGNSHLRIALSTARTITNTHPAVAPHVVETIGTRWDGFFSGYAPEWQKAVGQGWTPKRDVTSFVEWWVTGEARMLAVAAVAARA